MPTKFPRLRPETIAEIVRFVRRHELKSAHYWGWADKDLILALKGELGLNFGVTDYHDRWNRGAHFFNDDDPPMNLSQPEYAVPEWLDGISTYVEGIFRTNFVVDDLDPEPGERDFALEEFLENRGVSYLAVIRRDGLHAPYPPLFNWTRQCGVDFGIRRRMHTGEVEARFPALAQGATEHRAPAEH